MMRSEAELRELLPWYVNGTLDVATQFDIDSLIESSPLIRSEVAWLTQLRLRIQQAPSQAGVRSASTGLDTLMALVSAEQSGKVSFLPWRNRWNTWLASSHKLSVPMGLAAAVVLTQAAIIGALLNPLPPEQLSPLSGSAAARNVLLQVTFKPQATEVQIRSLLAGVKGEIISGPGALGVYTVRVPDGQAAVALAKLRNDRSSIESVVLLQSR